MYRFTTKIGLGIAISLSSSLLYSPLTLAGSLKFSDRKEPIILEAKPFFSEQFLSTPAPLDSQPRIQQKPEIISYFTEENSSPSLVFFAPEETQEVFADSTLNVSIQTESTSVEDLFADSTLSISIQQDNFTEAEDIDLLESLTEALGRLQFENAGNSSFNNVSVAILPQVAYGDIYRGLYDFEINLAAPRAPRAVANSIPSNSLISQESIGGYSSQFSASSSFQTNESGYSTNFAAYQNTLTSGTSSVGANAVTNSNGYEDLSTRLESVMSANTTVFTRQQEIEENQLRSGYVTPTQKFNSQKDAKLQELEQKLEMQKQIRERERRNLEMRLKQQQVQRDRQRQQQEENTRRQRENNLRRQLQGQRNTLRVQQNTIRNNSR